MLRVWVGLQVSRTFTVALARLAEINADVVRGIGKLARVVGDGDGGPKDATREMWFVVRKDKTEKGGPKMRGCFALNRPHTFTLSIVILSTASVCRDATWGLLPPTWTPKPIVSHPTLRYLIS